MALNASSVLPRNIRWAWAAKREQGAIQVSLKLISIASLAAAEVLAELDTGADGLTEEEAQARLEKLGPNVVAADERFTRLRLFIRACLNPIVILLAVLATVSFATAEDVSDLVGGLLMVVMIVLVVSLRFVQEVRARRASAWAPARNRYSTALRMLVASTGQCRLS
jgi:Mg2+-importing ATPase